MTITVIQKYILTRHTTLHTPSKMCETEIVILYGQDSVAQKTNIIEIVKQGNR